MLVVSLMIPQFYLKLDKVCCIGVMNKLKNIFSWLDKLMYKNELLLV